MIEVRGVTKEYGEVVAVRDVSLEIGRGELTVLIGPSGCGKSTLIRTINRMIEPTEGTVEIDGVDVRESRVEELRRGIGYVIQTVGLFPHFSVRENIATVPRLLGWERERTERRVMELLDMMGLHRSFADKRPRELSGGEAQRVGVARALAADPPILLMDEPFGAVDPQNRARLQEEFYSIQKRLKKTVVFVTHDVEEAVRLADRIALMRAGRVVQYTTPERFILEPAEAFVSEFLGIEYPLRLLGRHSVADCYRKDAAPGDTPGPGQAVPMDTPTREALSLLVASGQKRLDVVDSDGRVVGTFDFESVLGLLGGGPGGEG